MFIVTIHMYNEIVNYFLVRSSRNKGKGKYTKENL